MSGGDGPVELRDLFDSVETLGVRGDDGVDVTGIAHDSRRVTPGDLFCCVPGGHVDGHDFAAAAVAAGAVALLVERVLDLPVPQVWVRHVRDVMGVVADRAYGHPSGALTVVGVTGTNGKTTTTYLLERIAEAAGLVPGVVGTVATRIGGRPAAALLTTPEAPDLHRLLAGMREEEVGLVAMEVSSHALAQGRVDGVEFAAGVFLNLSHDHLDFHGSLDEYYAAKARLFEPHRVRTAAVNIADPRGRDLTVRCREHGIETVTFSGVGEAADVVATPTALDASGTTMTLGGHRFGDQREIRSTLLGSFNAVNVAGAAAGALAAGIPREAIVEGLSSEISVPGRFEPVGDGGRFTVVVDYAHTPDALAHALQAAREVGHGRVLAVFGCGGDRDRDKRPVMGRVASEAADVVYVTSDNPRSEDPRAIIDAIVVGIPDGAAAVVEPDRRVAIARAIAEAEPGDVVVVAGKGHETGQIVGGRMYPFDDRQVVAEELEALECA